MTLEKGFELGLAEVAVEKPRAGALVGTVVQVGGECTGPKSSPSDLSLFESVETKNAGKEPGANARRINRDSSYAGRVVVESGADAGSGANARRI